MSGLSGASPTKGRGRPLAPETVALMEGLGTILAEQYPLTVRGAFYQASTRDLVPKAEAGYKKVQRLLVKMREEKLIPWSWIADGTRWRRGPDTWQSPEEALRSWSQHYRRDLWSKSPEIVEVWLEKEALAGVIYPVIDEYAVDLMVCRGYPSLSFLHGAAEHAEESGKSLTIYYLGDRDPSGRDIPRMIAERLVDFGLINNCDFRLELLAVTDDQVEELELPSRPTKASDTRSGNFKGASVELDAIPAPTLRAIVESAIVEHVDTRELEVLRGVEAEEREGLQRLADRGWREHGGLPRHAFRRCAGQLLR